jgi:glycosyltransferase involved in cell wall biosynthesis
MSDDEQPPDPARPPSYFRRGLQALRFLANGQRELEELRTRSDANHHLLHLLLARQAEAAERHEQDRRYREEDRRHLEEVHHHLSALLAERPSSAQVDELSTDVASVVQALVDGFEAPAPPDGPLVTIIMPTYRRAQVIAGAIASVQQQTYGRWELLVLDDGGDDDTEAVVSPLLTDARISYRRVPRQPSVAAVRNHGLELATGDLIAYLDTDNTWHRSHLARHVEALSRDPGAAWSISRQLVADPTAGTLRLRNDLRSTEHLIEGNFIDINVAVHRRQVLSDIGPFDPTLTRLSDWDLALRLASLGAPVRTGAATSCYRVDLDDRISDREPLHVHAHAIRRRHRALPARDLRVLLAEWHYPQVTETYIAALVQGLVALGAEVAVWSEDEVAVPYPSSVPVHRGELATAIESFAPHVVVTSWLHLGAQFREITRPLGIPHVVRTHGFEYVPETLERLLADDGVLVHTFPHLVPPTAVGHPRLVVTPTFFDDDRYRPSPHKDPRLVVRTAAGLLTKDLDTFLLAANECPEHRFVLVLGHVLRVEHRTEAVIERKHELGSRCEIRVDLQHDEVAALLSEAGIYLHTHGTDHPVSMPMSIAEAMATGCWVLGRDLPGMADYIGPTGALYTGASPAERATAAAELINRSAGWSAARWAEVAMRASDQAYERHASRDVVTGMVASWRRAFDLPG